MSDLIRVAAMHAELDDFVAERQRAPRALIFKGSHADYSFHEVDAWPSLKLQLRVKLRSERAAAVAFWDSNRVCWSSGPGAAEGYAAYERGFYMLREQLPMPLVYVAGPYTAKTREGVLANIGRAEQLGIRVAELGAMPVIPHTNTSHAEFERAQSYRFWIHGTMELLRRSDAVILTSDWEISSGARGERAEAAHLGKPVFETPEELQAWMEALP